MQLDEIAKQLGCELRGNPDTEILGVAGILEATGTDLTFVSNPKYLRNIKESGAGAIILGPEAPVTSIPTLISKNPYLAFAKAIELFYSPPTLMPGLHPTAFVSDSAVLGEDYSIGANVVVGDDARIGNRAVLHPNVTIYPGAEIGDDFTAHSNSVVREYTRIGNRVILQNGAIVGADGFGFAPMKDKSYYKIVQSGIVIIEDDVELGANTCIDRATVGNTRVRRGTKLDNLVQIGHGSEVGEDTILAAQTGLAGSSDIGDRVMLAGQVGVAGHLRIGDDVIATAQTGIARSVKDGSKISGTPEMESGLWKKIYILLHNLPALSKEVKQLRKELDFLKGDKS
jgi:UDP-3-O-[3-hydroxymyristoyl] glucosamine N-acyltransferase